METLSSCEPALYETMRDMLVALGLNADLPHKKFGDALFLLTYFSRHFPDGPQIYCDDTLIAPPLE